MTRLICFVRMTVASLCACAAVLTTASGFAEEGPYWWRTRGVLRSAAATNDFAALNMGQLKHLAYMAWQELDTLPGGAGFVPAFTNAGNNYAAVNVGQLKEIARPFYDRLGPAGCYPWTGTVSSNDHAIANIGQAKCLFSFDPFSTDFDQDGMPNEWEVTHGFNPFNAMDAAVDAEHDGLPDAWETRWFGSTNVVDSPAGDADGDGFSDGTESWMRSNPVFAVSVVSTSYGKHQLSWMPCPGATNYTVIRRLGGFVDGFYTNGCSVVLNGDFRGGLWTYEVAANGPNVSEDMTATGYFQQPSQPNLKVWKLLEPDLVMTPPSLPVEGTNAVYERTIQISQKADWPHQFFIAATCAGDNTNSAACIYGLQLEVADSQGAVVVGPSAYDGILAVRVPVGTDVSALTVRLKWDAAYVNSHGSAQLVNCGLYLIDWVPSVTFAANNRFISTQGGPALVSLSDDYHYLNGVTFTVSYSGRPNDGTVPDLSAYSSIYTDAPFGGPLSYQYGSDGHSIIGGSLREMGGNGPYTFWPAGFGQPSSGTGADPLVPPFADGNGIHAFTFYNIDPAVSGQWNHQSEIVEELVGASDLNPGDYPLDTPCLRKAVHCNEPGYLHVVCTNHYSASPFFLIDVQGLSDIVSSSLVIDPAGGYHVWGTGEWSYYASIRVNGNLLWSATVTRGEDYTREEYNDWIELSDITLDDSCGCALCDTGECKNIEGESNGSVRFRVPLGATGYNRLAGFVWFSAQGSNVTVNPPLFSVLGDPSVQTNGTPEGGLRVYSTDPGGRDVRINPVSRGVRVSIGDYQEEGVPPEDHAWEIVNTGPDNSQVLFRKLSGDDTQKTVLYSFEGGCWVRRPCDPVTGNPLPQSEISQHIALGGGREGVTNRVYDGENLVKLSYGETELIGSGSRAVKRETVQREWDGSANVWRETVSAYWRDDNNILVNGRLRFRAGSCDGSWEYHAYDAVGRETLSAVPLNGSPAPAFVTNSTPVGLSGFAACQGLSARVTVNEYDPGSTNSASNLDVRNPRITSGYVVADGVATLTSCEGHFYSRESVDGYAAVRHRVVTAESQSMAGYCGYPDVNPWRETVAYADEVSESGPGVLVPDVLFGRPLSEDGGLAAWTYETGQYDPEAAESFTPDVDGAYYRITARRGTAEHPGGVGNKSTIDVEIIDALFGRTLRREMRVVTANGSELLSWEKRGYDAKGHHLGTVYSDGTCESNEWDCCGLSATVGRDGVRRQTLGVPGDDSWSASTEEALGRLPGAGGCYPVTERFMDALGRETNSVRSVWSNGAPVSAYAPLSTRTVYPHGTSGCSVTVDPLGVETISRRYYENGLEIDETASAGVTSFVTRVQGGASVSEKIWHDAATGAPAWTRETRTTSWRSDGCRVETVTSEASDMPAPVVASETVYDFFGRAVVVTTPLGVTSSIYGGAPVRLVRVIRSGSPDTYYFYDELGNVVETVLDVDGMWPYCCVDSPDRRNAADTVYEKIGDDWYHVTYASVKVADEGPYMQVSCSRQRLTGLGAAAPSISTGAVLTAQSETLDWRGNSTVSYTYTDAASVSSWQVTGTPQSWQPAVRASVAGRPVSDVSVTAVATTYTYDGFARQTAATDGRGNTSRTVYNLLGQVEFTEDAASNRTVYSCDELGRQVSVSAPSSNTVFTAYDSPGNVVRRWGATYPVEYGYDSRGRMVSMMTFRDENGAGDETRWMYDDATGLLTNKVYADGSGTSYTYTPEGRLATRTWARGVTTSYAYDAAGQLVSVDYSDGTPDVAYTYDRLGRQTSAITSVSTNSFTYSGLDLYVEAQNGDTLTRDYDFAGRPYAVGVNNRLNSSYWLGWGLYEFATYHGYDMYGRSSAVGTIHPLDPECYDYTCFNMGYEYLTGSELVNKTQGILDQDYWSTFVPPFSRTCYFEPNRDLITAVSNFWDTTPVSAYTYENDALGRRTARDDFNGSVVTPNAFGYNLRSEVTNAVMGSNTYGYEYDPIGNRIAASGSGASSTYSANRLNQYTNIVGGVTVTPAYDADGNMVSCGPWAYTWDGENRLASVWSNNVLVVTNVYDHMSRRIAKIAGGTQHTFLYDGWNPIREIRNQESGASTNYYTWGMDLSGTLQGAGGVGGLLAVTKDDGSVYFPAYDANGNVTAYLDSTGMTVALREFDAFGNTVSETVAAGLHLPFWFSTKCLDDETGMYYYGYRFYSSELGRWVNRDPIEEDGGVNIYGFVLNEPVSDIDVFGLKIKYNHRDKSKEQLEVECDCDESINSLAKHFGLEADEGVEWLDIADGKQLPATNTEKFSEQRKFRVPNVIVFTYGNMYSRLGTRKVMNFLNARRNVAITHYEGEGFLVKNGGYTLTEESMTLDIINNDISGKSVYGWAHFGHGIGGQLVITGLNNEQGIPTGFNYGPSEFKPSHRLAEVALYACEAGQMAKEWRAHVLSPNGVLYGSEVTIYPPFALGLSREPWNWPLKKH